MKYFKKLISAALAVSMVTSSAAMLSVAPVYAVASDVTTVFSEDFSEGYTDDKNWVVTKEGYDINGTWRLIADTSQQDEKVAKKWLITGYNTNGYIGKSASNGAPNADTSFVVTDDPAADGSHGKVLKLTTADSGDYSPMLIARVSSDTKPVVSHENGKKLYASADIYIPAGETAKFVQGGQWSLNYKSALFGFTDSDYGNGAKSYANISPMTVSDVSYIGIGMGDWRTRNANGSGDGLGNASTYADPAYYNADDSTKTPWFTEGKWVKVEYLVDTTITPSYTIDSTLGVDKTGTATYMTYRLYIDGNPVSMKRSIVNADNTATGEYTYDIFGIGEGYKDSVNRLGSGMYGVSFAPQAATEGTPATYYIDNIEIKYMPVSEDTAS